MHCNQPLVHNEWRLTRSSGMQGATPDLNHAVVDDIVQHGDHPAAEQVCHQRSAALGRPVFGQQPCLRATRPLVFLIACKTQSVAISPRSPGTPPPLREPPVPGQQPCLHAIFPYQLPKVYVKDVVILRHYSTPQDFAVAQLITGVTVVTAVDDGGCTTGNAVWPGSGRRHPTLPYPKAWSTGEKAWSTGVEILKARASCQSSTGSRTASETGAV